MVTPVPVPTAAGVEPAFDLSAYYPILLFAGAAAAFALGSLLATHVFPFKPRKPTRVKQMPYESGMDPVGSARMQFDIKFYLIAILFLVFDVELLFLYPWAVLAYGDGGSPAWREAFGTVVFVEILVFLATLAIAYVYAWRKGVFQWR
ncbi:NADH-quinone oxidoreductase subunit A [Urbifossiella limnaea]|uniref:NADH-quinone oxidoreductase subunit A n=1 Tax=Urbifossiella limnaea TaxID=2528023 RepID=A0A517XLP0_9BACT|nr:NADH-quinone oxidoreductase subunit A [Urbifossiella limnaea]QDU18420.1 NAD(P)H-quinone oxidoreductase subunit 3 [Urbifossiella limnaea]